MLTLAVEDKNESYEIMYALPEKVRSLMKGVSRDSLCEIRLRQGMPLALVYTDGTYYLTKKGFINIIRLLKES